MTNRNTPSAARAIKSSFQFGKSLQCSSVLTSWKARWQGINKQKVDVLEYKMADVETNMDMMTSHNNTLGEELMKVNSVISNMGELSG
jgi:hypothetical protein